MNVFESENDGNLIIYDASPHRPCCAEAQARVVWGGGSPPGKLKILPTLCMESTAAEAREQALRHPLMGKQLRPARAGIYLPAFFSLGPVHCFLPGDGGSARRGNNNTMALPMGPVPSIAAGEFPLNRSGVTPLSLTTCQFKIVRALI